MDISLYGEASDSIRRLSQMCDINHPDIFRQSATNLDSNEVTADVFLNRVWYINTQAKAGFTPDEAGEQWVNFFDQYMRQWMRNAIVHNMPLERQIDLYQEQGYINNVPGTAEIAQRGWYIYNDNLAQVRGIGTREGEIYAILGWSSPYIIVLQGQNVRAIHNEAFGTLLNNAGEPITVADIHQYEVRLSQDALFTFDPSQSFSETEWAFELFGDNH